MTTLEIANRFYELAQDSNWDQIQDELYSSDAESIEPENEAFQGTQRVKGLKQIKEKGKIFENMVEQVHGSHTGKPIVAGNHFAVAIGMDATMKDTGRVNTEEIAVYEVRNGKIVKEQFFF